MSEILMSKGKTLYYAVGRYKYNGIWNDIPDGCRYFYAVPGREKNVLRGRIVAHRGLIKEAIKNITLSRLTTCYEIKEVDLREVDFFRARELYNNNVEIVACHMFVDPYQAKPNEIWSFNKKYTPNHSFIDLCDIYDGEGGFVFYYDADTQPAT